MRLQNFIDGQGLARYVGSVTRDAGPAGKESRLSAYFRLGLLSMVSVYWSIDRSTPQGSKWLRRMAWRDYAYWMLSYWPRLPTQPMRPAYSNLEWASHGNLVAWREGRTGYPLLDAAMLELRQTGYLQQHLRHVTGQFLVEVLGVSWVEGERWYHICLADADAAINAMMWQHQGLVGVSQWLTTIECDPVLHARKCDPDGSYVRRFCPELAQLPTAFIHTPWKAPPNILSAAGVRLGDNYPHRVVHDTEGARVAFMDRFRSCRAAAPEGCIDAAGNDVIDRPLQCQGRRGSIFALTEKKVKAVRGSEPTQQAQRSVRRPGNPNRHHSTQRS